jgi:dipeptidase D
VLVHGGLGRGEKEVFMSSAIEELRPEALWRHFADISGIPRCSKNEEAAARHVVETAQRLGLESRQDDAGNVVVRKPASPGREGVRSVCLQGHLDMVCEKNADSGHDFTRDPIRLVREGNLLRADGTTLGADNGIAVATMLALMEDRGLEHGPLELLFTVDEETGLTGAGNLQSDFLESRTLVNLDSEDEGILYVGCAGGRDTGGRWPAAREAPAGKVVAARLEVKGLRGGHSGLDIHLGRGNAIKILTRVLLRLAEIGGRVARLEGGNKRNALPREASAEFFLPRSRIKRAEKLVAGLEATIKAELSLADPDLSVTLSVCGEGEGQALKRHLQKKILRAVCALPHGVIRMSPDIEGLVQTSTNVAVVQTLDGEIRLETSQRSSVASEIEEIAETVASVFLLAGAAVESGAGYPGWQPDLNSEILAVAKSTFRDCFGREPEVAAVHAGLECGIIGEKFPGMDMVSLGPTLEAVHSPEERIHIDTVERFWDYLLAILRNVT